MFGAHVAVADCQSAQEVMENAGRVMARRKASYDPLPVVIQISQTEPVSVPVEVRRIPEPDILLQITRIRDIQDAVCGHYNITRCDLLSDRRTANVVFPRQVAMYLCKKLTLRSLPEIGRRFSGRDHTTVLHAVRKMTARQQDDPDFSGDLEKIKTRIRTIVGVRHASLD